MSLNDYYKQVLINWFQKEKSEREFLDEVINIIEREWSKKNIFIVEAPTGYGKSVISATIALFSIKSDDSLKCIVAFPLRALLEDQYCKFVGGFEGRKGILGDLRRERMTMFIGKRYMHNPDSRYLIKPITLTTIDTLAMTLFGIPPEYVDSVVKAWDGTIGGSLGHYLFSWGSVISSNIVLDEVHLLADSTRSLSFLVALMKIAQYFGQKLILMSATVPKSLKSLLSKYLSDKIRFIEFSVDKDPFFLKDRVDKKYHIIFKEIESTEKYERIREWVEENKEFSRVIIVFNTVKEAIDFYKYIRDAFKDRFDEIVLIHSRFTEKDRESKVSKIANLGKPSSPSKAPKECEGDASLSGAASEESSDIHSDKYDRSNSRYMIISTQVIEAGIDISSNLFITDVAPANSLIQRLGRFLRYVTEEDKEGKAIIWYEKITDEDRKNNGLYKIYDRSLVEKTVEWLKNNSDEKHDVKLNVHLPEVRNSEKKGYKELLDYVYKDGYFKVEDDLIRDFEGIFLHLENASLIAVEKFLEMEGSFVRNEFQVPVTPKSKIEGILDENNVLGGESGLSPDDFIREFVIPLSFGSFRNRTRDICGIIIMNTRAKGDRKHDKLEFKKSEDDTWLSRIIKRMNNEKSSNEKSKIVSDFLRYIFIRKVLAFVINAEYDEDLGLEV